MSQSFRAPYDHSAVPGAAAHSQALAIGCAQFSPVAGSVTEAQLVVEGKGDPTCPAQGPFGAGMSAPHFFVSETQRLQMLNEISRALAAQLDTHDVYDTIYEQITQVMDTSMFILTLRREDSDQTQVAYLREFGRKNVDVNIPAGASVTAHVFKLGKPLLFHTSDQYERYALSHGLPVIVLGDLTHGPAQSMIFAPLNTGSETIGTVSIQSTRPYAYSKDDFDTLAVIASQAAVAVQNSRLYEASVEAALRRQALLRVAETVNGSLELTSVFQAILNGIHDVMPYHLAAIMMPDHKRTWIEAVGAVGELAEDRRRELRIPIGQGVTGRVFQTGEAIVVEDVTAFEGYITGSDMVRSEVAVPLKRGQVVVGVLNVERADPNAFRDQDVRATVPLCNPGRHCHRERAAL